MHGGSGRWSLNDTQRYGLSGMPRPQDELSQMMQVVWKPLSSWLDTFAGKISFIHVIKGKPCTLLKAREAEVEFVQHWFSLSFKSKSSICQRSEFGG